MEIGRLIKILQSYADRCGNKIPVKAMDPNRQLNNVYLVELCEDSDHKFYVYIES